MKKISWLTILLALSACGRVGYDYQPLLAQTPKNTGRYESDRKMCISEATKRMQDASESHKDDKLIPVFGLVGYAVGNSTASPNDDYWKKPSAIVDECMTKKGYKVISN